MMSFSKRWHTAQKYEETFWMNAAQRIIRGASSQLDWYAYKARIMEDRLAGFIRDRGGPSSRVLEVGSGPIGIVTYMNWGLRYTLDPLEDFYRSNSVLSKLRKPEVTYCKGSGEKIPFEDNSCALVILDNMLDHVNEPRKVLQECARVLSADGLLYLVVNVHTSWGAFLHTFLSKTRIDKGHPYTFTPESISAFVNRHGFDILRQEHDDYLIARAEDRASESLKAKVKGFTGLSEFIYYAVCRKSAFSGSREHAE